LADPKRQKQASAPGRRAEDDRQSVRHCRVDADEAGQRVDNYLLARLKGVPRSHVYRLIRSGQVRVNAGRVGPRYRLEAGDTVRLPPVRCRPAAKPPGASGGLDWLAERIVYEDDRLIVVDKPAGLAVHGGSGLDFGLIEGLRSLRPEAKTLELAHRLDRATSGCIMVAKRRSALRQLNALLREGAVDKRYLALVKGDWQHGTLEIDTPLSKRHAAGGAKVRPDAEGKPTLSRFRLVERYGGTASLVEVSILTGRTHQIRVHAASIGHPIAGDERYGDPRFNADCASRGLKRMFLHAQLLAFTWPDSGETLAVSAPLSGELRLFLDQLAA
jgi:23S rRNA pseudouridine955/2504/2580 synthase